MERLTISSFALRTETEHHKRHCTVLSEVGKIVG